ncbi:MAG: hypothetical protein KBT27_07950 [Prevotellaceae bacterium]|nr:hypothetical protein [Candidatus Faecinaster equi]
MSSHEDNGTQTEIILDPETGTASIGSKFLRQGNEVEPNYEEFLDAMFDYIS